MTNQAHSMPSVLQRIVATKQAEIAKAKADLPESDLIAQARQIQAQDPASRRGFAKSLRKADPIGIIAEIKRASPSKGIINHDFDPVKFAQGYEKSGATCLSVLTDVDYFKGADDFLVAARKACNLPVLRKDFMIEAYQIYQSFMLGADCILLIMACLDDKTAHELHAISLDLGMDVLIEIHTDEELQRALNLPFSLHNLYGINNRNLNTFEVNLNNSLRLKADLAKALQGLNNTDQQALIVTESGIHSAQDVQFMVQNGIRHFLIGEQFMKTANPAQALKDLYTQYQQLAR